jgi:exonuclease III
MSSNPLSFRIPTYTTTTFNLRGLSAYSNSTRRADMLNNIRALTLHSDIVLLQETHLHLHDHQYLHKAFPRWGVYNRNCSSHQCGVISYLAPASYPITNLQ